MQQIIINQDVSATNAFISCTYTRTDKLKCEMASSRNDDT